MGYANYTEAADRAAVLAAELDIPLYVFRRERSWEIGTFPDVTPEYHLDDLAEFSCTPIGYFGGFISPRDPQADEDEFEDDTYKTGPNRDFHAETDELKSILGSLRSASEAGDCRAALKYGNISWFRGDYNLALLNYKIAAKELPEACIKIADMYEYGQVVGKDLGYVVEWTEAAATLGDIDAMVEIGKLHLETFNQYAGDENGISWLKRAASLGSEEAQRILKDIDA